MSETCFPIFQEGQTLTRDDLTLLREFFDDRAREVARAVGFGISCGLDGEVTTAGGAAVVIDPGIGIDHAGEVLTLETGVHLALPPAATETGYDFVDPAPGGFTVVLVAHEVETAAPACNEVGCEGHAGTRCRTAELVIVPGRLAGPSFDISADPLVKDNVPLTANPTAAAYDALRAKILARLADTLSAAAKAKLASISIGATDLLVIKNAKAAFLNQVLFAALDLVRCRELMSFGCLRDTPKPGVALGWVHQVGADWKWECNHRHAWEPPAGLSIALVGGACDDPCKIHRDRIEALILTFELPAVPKPDEPPKPGGEIVDPYLPCGKHKGSKYVVWEDCGFVFVPPFEVPEEWYIPWSDPPFEFNPGNVDPVPPWEVYGQPAPDYFDEGLMNLQAGYGHGPAAVTEGLTKAVVQGGLKPNVQVLTVDAALALPGFMPTATASPADTIILGKDSRGKVALTGVIPAQVGIRDASSAIPAASAKATEALATANGLKGDVAAHGTALAGLSPQVSELTAFQKTAGDKLKVLEGVAGGLQTQILNGARQVYAEVQGTMATVVNNSVVEAVSMVQQDLDSRITQQVKGGFSEFGDQVSRLSERTEQALIGAERSNKRIDQALVLGKGVRGGDLEGQTAFNADLVKTLRTMTDVLEQSAPEARRPAVREQLTAGKDALERMEGSTRGGSLVLLEERESLATLLDSMVGGLRAAGAGAAQLKDLQAGVKALKEQLN